MTNYSRRSGNTMSEGIMGAIKSNPEGLLTSCCRMRAVDAQRIIPRQ